MSDEEEYVRERWLLTHECDGSYRHYSPGTALIQDVHGHWLNFDSWQAARAFTEAREEAIRQLEAEVFAEDERLDVALYHLRMAIKHGSYHSAKELTVSACRLARILAREQAALEELRRNWKGK